MKKTVFAVRSMFGMIVFVSVLASCAHQDIGDYGDVMEHIQGTWTGHDYNAGVHRHIKLVISDNTFKGWLQVSDGENEPEWTAIPGEEGTLSLSSVLDDPDNRGKYRKISFYMRGRCCGDNSLTARTLSNLVAYYEGGGLTVTGRQPMAKR